jgi:8-oxo-dGTP pyrophosphatase MutT (NUDIX family)
MFNPDDAQDGPLEVLLTQRTDKLKKHSGQVAFPGGKQDPQDADAQAAALREAWEEVGIEPSQVTVLGQLNAYETGTGFLITPVVGLVSQRVSLQINDQEVAQAFRVPLSFLMNPAHHQRRQFQWENGPRQFYAMPYQSDDQEYFIWGATAAILRNFYQFVRA